MIKAVLFDLDDTLLGNDMDKFLPNYFTLLGKHAERYLEKNRFLQELMAGTQAMIASTDTAVSNRDAFWYTFQQRTGLDPDEMEPFFEQFYRNVFPQLVATTEKRPLAAPLVQTCLDKGLKVVVATNPLFPAIAVEERLDWAGVPVTEFDYDLVTTYENMHTTKPHPAYYHEILQMIDCAPETAVMIGDDWKNDIIPAASIGLHTYWITADGQQPPDETPVNGRGSLADLWQQVQKGWLEQLT
ncbi:MAG: HAD family hydrolase [Ardenticatenaceae bacterium]|nr:HAD family hydrolase [Ardenticatenaceae bacterium]MCB9443029.1 HAD family hydrolase [Ardenticatenaceae bacterium]